MRAFVFFAIFAMGCQSTEPWQDQQTPTTTTVRELTVTAEPFTITLVIVYVDQSGDVGGRTDTTATQETKVDAKADVKVPVR